jgi:hypothetical protein
VATAQVQAWVGAHRGSLDEAASVIDATLADAALGRMMLHRRRAIVASMMSEFFAHMGSRFGRYLEGRAPRVPADPLDELAVARTASEIVDKVCGGPAPLLFERALLAEADGRLGDAQADLKQVLAAYPGFPAAAIAAGRVALAAADPGQAIRSLASVEREVTHTREGATLLADAVRAVGLHQAASRYDLAALICRGAYDSRGNDCAPVDLMGKVANDDRMRQILYLESQSDGGIICNAGGVYYRVNPLFGRLLLVFNRGHTLSNSYLFSLGPGRSNGRTRTVPEIFEAATGRLRLLVGDRLPNGFVILRKGLVAVWCSLRRMLTAAFRLIASIAIALVIVLYRSYRRLPTSVRSRVNKYLLLPRLRYSIAQHLGPHGRWRRFSEISEPNARWRLEQARYQSGVAHIFGLQMSPVSTDATDRVPNFGQQQISSSYDAAAPSDNGLLKMPAPGDLPPLAEEVLRRLVSEVGRRPVSPQS